MVMYLRHRELASAFVKELEAAGWIARNNKGLPNGYIADALFDKDGEVLALEIGILKRDKCEGLRALIEAGKLNLLHVSYLGEITLLDKSYFPKDWPYSSFVR